MRRAAGKVALVLAVGLAGCGGSDAGETRRAEPRLPESLAADLAARSDRIADRLAAGDGCGAATQAAELQRAVIDAINARGVPAALQEELQSAANALAARIDCVPPAPPPAPAADTVDEDDEGEARGKRKGRGKGRGKGKGDGEDD